MMKRGKRMLAAVLALGLIMTGLPAVSTVKVNAEDVKPIPRIRLSVGNGQTTPQYKAGEKAAFSVKVENQGDAAANHVRITPVIENEKEWPFEIQNMNEEKVLETIDPGVSTEAIWEWTVRSDVETRAYKTVFRISYADQTNEYQEDKVIYVKTTEAEKEEPGNGENQQGTGNGTENQNPGGENGSPQEGNPPAGAGGDLGAGAIYNADPVASGGGSTNGSVPRVIVTGFSTDPGTVNAGSNFRLTVHIKNTSTTTAVSNMLFDLQAPSAGTEAAAEAPAFLPASGSSSVYLDSIPAGEIRDISIDMNARADLVQKPYSISMSMKYEDNSAAQFEGSSSLAIPVQQAARFEFSEIEIAPESIQVGEEANITCSLYNTGRTKLYNVKVKFAGDGISAKDVFVGNVESGATGTIDGMITGESEIPAGTKCKMVVSYEDEAGKVSTKEEEFELEVIPAAAEEMEMAAAASVEEKGFPVFPVVIGGVVLAAIVVAVLLVRRKKKKQAWAEEEDLADEVDRFTEDE